MFLRDRRTGLWVPKRELARPGVCSLLAINHLNGFGAGAVAEVTGQEPFWNSADKDADFTLSGSDRIATGVGSGGVRSTISVATDTQGWYILGSLTENNGTATRLGIATSAHTITSSPGSTATSWVIQGGGLKMTNSSTAAYGSTLTLGATQMIAYKNGKVWIGQAGTWFNSGDPAADTGEMFSGITGSLFLIFGSNNTTSRTFELFALSDGNYTTYPAPAGFLKGWGA